MKDYCVETNQVTKAYRSLLALDGVSIRVPQGSIYGLVGDNGAGKSTLLKVLAGHSFVQSGELKLFGKFEEKDLMQARRNTGCMVERPGFFPNMTVEQNLKYYCIQRGVPDPKRVEELLLLAGIADKRKSKCRHLSLGQLQRLGLAIALIGEPRLLILDEPINGLDPSGIIEFRKLLHRLNEEKNITILMSSHILAELSQLATVYGFLSKGKLLEEINARALKEKCPDSIEIILSDVEAYAVYLEREFPEDTYQVLPNQTICIHRPRKQAEAYSRLAMEHQIYITGMRSIQTSLEEYYMELKKRRGAL